MEALEKIAQVTVSGWPTHNDIEMNNIAKQAIASYNNNNHE